ncbi:MAG TPA: hypothetical protein VF146_02290, partial [Bryobacteraceae bacterium]
HVQWNIGILHPEADLLIAVEIEQHAAAFWQILAIHEPLRPVGIVVDDLDREEVHSGPAGNLKRLLYGWPDRASSDQ